MRGEQSAFSRSKSLCTGSPPLARGTGTGSESIKDFGGITPACAGNSFLPASFYIQSRDHPRLRGEQLKTISREIMSGGSPPLARGTAPWVRPYAQVQRITPACAGNSIRGIRHASRTRDHPRLRGEQRFSKKARDVSQGSPPLARGTARNRLKLDSRSRITPACAGNRQTIDTDDAPSEDHPRLRGEQRGVRSAMATCRGSPPLARGTACQDSGRTPLPGITPACAGNSQVKFGKQLFHGDHPRLRGEQFISISSNVCTLGSPPLARGTGRGLSLSVLPYGITPACAGNSPRPRYIVHWRKDHPRLRGEQRKWAVTEICRIGSPPLARGTAHHVGLGCRQKRITPACAGNR